jgi:hypothetical protein
MLHRAEPSLAVGGMMNLSGNLLLLFVTYHFLGHVFYLPSLLGEY